MPVKFYLVSALLVCKSGVFHDSYHSLVININAQKRGDVLADIISAEELSNEQKNDIENQLKSILGNKISLNYKVNKKIIGGLIVKVGSKMIDSSLASKINKIKIAIKET